MIYLFEDDKDELLSKLFLASYRDEALDRIKYCCGNAKLLDEAIGILRNTTENVACYLDSVPGNKQIIQIYKDLAQLSKDNSYRVIVFPIVCSEYYFIKSLCNNTKYMEFNKDVSICINKGDFTKSDVFNDPVKGKICKNFEKYCKVILLNYVRDCINISRGYPIENEKYGAYYTEDCICKFGDSACRRVTLIEKSIQLLSEYDCVPSGSIKSVKTPISNDGVWDIHRKLVDEFNSFNTFYKNNVKMKNAQYAMMKYIK